MKIGYARVSTDDQNLCLQLDALRADGCRLVFEDKASGSTLVCAGLSSALARCGSGDILVVWKLDRLGRSLLDLVGLVETLQVRGAGLKILTGQGAQIDTSKPDGRMFFGILATMAQFERELIAERTKAGLAAAKRRGIRLGRPPLLTPVDIAKACRMIAAGRNRKEVASCLHVSPLTLRRALDRKRIYVGHISDPRA